MSSYTGAWLLTLSILSIAVVVGLIIMMGGTP
jgi:hypothetical protein